MGGNSAYDRQKRPVVDPAVPHPATLFKPILRAEEKDARPLTPNSFSARGTGQCARRNGFTKGRRPGKMLFQINPSHTTRLRNAPE